MGCCTLAADMAIQFVSGREHIAHPIGHAPNFFRWNPTKPLTFARALARPVREIGAALEDQRKRRGGVWGVGVARLEIMSFRDQPPRRSVSPTAAGRAHAPARVRRVE